MLVIFDECEKWPIKNRIWENQPLRDLNKRRSNYQNTAIKLRTKFMYYHVDYSTKKAIHYEQFIAQLPKRAVFYMFNQCSLVIVVNRLFYTLVFRLVWFLLQHYESTMKEMQHHWYFYKNITLHPFCSSARKLLDWRSNSMCANSLRKRGESIKEDG